jgi:hypothetical protein
MTVEVHSFRDMLDHLENGGAAHRYGNYYPLYRIDARGLTGKSLKRRIFMGSTGEVENGELTTAFFSADEQAANDWVFIDGDELAKRDERSRQLYQEQLNRETVRPPPKPVKQSWWRRWLRCR